jgi:hypothetical protein
VEFQDLLRVAQRRVAVAEHAVLLRHRHHFGHRHGLLVQVFDALGRRQRFGADAEQAGLAEVVIGGWSRARR